MSFFDFLKSKPDKWDDTRCKYLLEGHNCSKFMELVDGKESVTWTGGMMFPRSEGMFCMAHDEEEARRKCKFFVDRKIVMAVEEARGHFGNRNYERCAQLFEEAYALSPESLNSNDLFLLGFCYSKLGEHSRALIPYEKSMRTDKHSAGYKAFEENKKSSFIDVILLLLGGQTGNFPYMNLAVLCNYAFTLSELKRYQEAKWCVDYILKFWPEGRDEMYDMAIMDAATLQDELVGMNLAKSPTNPLETAILRKAWKKELEKNRGI